MDESTKEFVIKFTRSVIENFVKFHKVLKIPKDYPKELEEKRGVFVTLYKDSFLRGCVGIPYPVRSIIENLKDAAVSTTMDPRFLPLTESELKDIKIEVSVLTEPEIIRVKNYSEYLDKIKEGVDGLIIKKNGNEGLFLPQVWKEIPDKVKFLENLCMKAGLPPDEWKSQDMKIYKFQVEAITEL